MFIADFIILSLLKPFWNASVQVVDELGPAPVPVPAVLTLPVPPVFTPAVGAGAGAVYPW